jgi:hypothetical protein
MKLRDEGLNWVLTKFQVKNPNLSVVNLDNMWSDCFLKHTIWNKGQTTCHLPTIHLLLYAVLGTSSWHLQTNKCEATDL